MVDPPVCDRCAGAMAYHGRISLPPQTIYRCGSCGNQKWTAEAPQPHWPQGRRPVEQPQAQQQQQQQQQSQPNPKSGEE